ncbi:hypothetical protein D3C85_1782130 [compost metagenome]
MQYEQGKRDYAAGVPITSDTTIAWLSGWLDAMLADRVPVRSQANRQRRSVLPVYGDSVVR